MTLIIGIPLLAVIVGALIYALSTNGKAAQLGFGLYEAGMIVFIYELATHVVRIG